MTRNRGLLVGLSVVVALAVALALLRSGGKTASAVAPKAAQVSRPGALLEPLQSPEELTASPSEPPQIPRTAVEDGLGDLAVLVLDRATDRPLAGVPVLLRLQGETASAESSSGADGRCRFENLQPGEYTLAPGPHGDMDFGAEPTPVSVAAVDPEQVVLRVEPRWFLAGVVVEKGSERPVDGVALMARDGLGKASSLATSTEGGRFRSRRSYPAGELGVFISQDQTEGLMRTHGDGPELLRVTVGQQDVTRLTIEIDWVGVVHGVVLDERERPVANAGVRLLSADSIYLANARLRFWGLYEGMRELGRTGRCDDEGRFSLERLPNDRTLTVVASAPGFAPGRSPDLSPPFLGSDDAVVLHLAQGGTIAGTVLDARGEPMGEAIVLALSADSDYQPDPTRSDAQGAYRLEGLKPGPTEVTAQVRGDNGLSHAVASGEVEVIAGKEVELILQAGADGLHLRGIAVDQDGRLITGDRLALSVRATPLAPQPGEPAWGHDTPVEPDGTFDVTVSRRATYQLTLLSRSAGDRWESQDVQAPAQDLRLTFTIVPSSQLSVRALDAQSGESIDSGHYSLSWERGSFGGNFTGGGTVATVQQGLYTVTMSAKGYAPVSQELDLRGPLQAKTLVELRLERGRAVSGRVVDGTGQPLNGCSVVVFTGRHLDLENLVYSGVDGRFTLPSAPLSGGEVWVIDENYRMLASAAIGAGDVVLTVEGK